MENFNFFKKDLTSSYNRLKDIDPQELWEKGDITNLIVKLLPMALKRGNRLNKPYTNEEYDMIIDSLISSINRYDPNKGLTIASYIWGVMQYSTLPQRKLKKVLKMVDSEIEYDNYIEEMNQDELNFDLDTFYSTMRSEGFDDEEIDIINEYIIEEKSLKSVGLKYNKTGENIRQRKSVIIRRMKKNKKIMKFFDFLR